MEWKNASRYPTWHTKKWVSNAGIAQNRLGRSLLHVNYLTTTMAILSELCWLSIQHRIEVQKLRFWEHLQLLPETRWTKQALLMILDGQYTSLWFHSILKIRKNILSHLHPSSPLKDLVQCHQMMRQHSWGV